MTEKRSGGEILVANLLAQGVRHAFCVPGESYLPVLDALYDARDRLSLYVCRHEGGAAYMAEAAGKFTGRPGIAFVTRGPGATNAAIGVHVAAQDSSPMILFVGQVGREFMDREAFQEIDYRRMYGSVAKWVAQIDQTERIPEYVARAFRVAMGGRPGPVVLALPEDVLAAEVAAIDAPRVEPIDALPDPGLVAEAHRLLTAAARPFVMVGGSRWNPRACALLVEFAEARGLPIACAFRHQDLFDNRHPQYAGDVGLGVNPKLAERLRNADVLMVIGERLGEITTGGYELLRSPVPTQALLHVHPGIDELGRVYQPTVAINATPEAFLCAMNALPAEPTAPARAALASAASDLAAWRAPRPMAGTLDLWQAMAALDERLPDDTIVTNGAGNYSVWLHRLFRYRGYRTQLAPYAGSMGYGVPSAVAAKALCPQRMVLSWNGDGCYLMNGQELATAVQYQLPIIFFVVDNGMYGTIRMHQERHYPDRVHGTTLANPDFAALARAYGAHAETVTRTDEFVPAFERARASGKPALLHLVVDPQALTMNASLDAVREQGRAARRAHGK